MLRGLQLNHKRSSLQQTRFQCPTDLQLYCLKIWMLLNRDQGGLCHLTTQEAREYIKNQRQPPLQFERELQIVQHGADPLV